MKTTLPSGKFLRTEENTRRIPSRLGWGTRLGRGRATRWLSIRWDSTTGAGWTSPATRHSDALHVTERLHRRDFGHIDVQLTIDDPKTYTRPFTIKFTQRLLPDTDLIENFCSENEKD